MGQLGRDRADRFRTRQVGQKEQIRKMGKKVRLSRKNRRAGMAARDEGQIGQLRR